MARFFDAPVYEVDTLAPGFPGLDASQANFAVTAELLDELITTLGAMSDLELELLWLIVRQRAQSPAALAPEVEQVRSLFDRLSRIEALDLSEAHATALELATVARLYLEQSGVKGEQADAIAAALAELEAGLNALLIVPGERSPDDTVVQVACAGIVVVAGGILANDVTGVGVVDDLLLIPLGIALGGLLLYDAARGRQASAEKTNEALVGVSAGAAKLTQEILESLNRSSRPPSAPQPPAKPAGPEAIIAMLLASITGGDSDQSESEPQQGQARTTSEVARDGWVGEPPEAAEERRRTGARAPEEVDERASPSGTADESASTLDSSSTVPQVEADEVMIDSNTAIALLKHMTDPTSLQHGEKAAVEALVKNGWARFRVADDVVAEVQRGTVVWARVPLRVSRESQAYRELLVELEQARVGGVKQNSERDRRIVADAFFAETVAGVTPTFATRDGGVSTRLYEMSGGDLKALGMPLYDALPDGFLVESNQGMKLKVIPLPWK